MANRLLKPMQGCLEAGIVKLYGHVNCGTSGAITSQTSKGFTVTKTASKTGRYTVTLEDSYIDLRSCDVRLVGAADAAYTSGDGCVPMLRNVDVVTTKTFYVQFIAPSTSADAEVDTNAQFYLEITLKNSQAY